MCYFQEFLLCLHEYLSLTPNINNSIIRKHCRLLDETGDFSYSINTLSLRVREPLENFSNLKDLQERSRTWKLQIAKCSKIDDNVFIFLDRITTFKNVILQALEMGCKYGSEKISFTNKFVLKHEVRETDLSLLSLSHLRVILLGEVLRRCIAFSDCTYKNDNVVEIQILQSNLRGKAIFCAGVTKSNISAEEFYKKRSIDMRLMAEHKYGLRITKTVGWQTLFEKLGHAAVIIDLLQNHPTRTFTISIDSHYNSSSKGAAFILYNCARLATLFKEFDKKVADKVYPILPLYEEVDLSLLVEAEEWELLFVYVLQFPSTVQNCIKDILDHRINVHSLCFFLTGMCSVFSVYYRRVRILTEPREHLYSFIHARIILLKAVEQVLHNGLYLLNIEPVKQM